MIKRVSSFLSGFETILTDLERRTASGDIIHGYTVIGTDLIAERDPRGFDNRAAAELFERLIQLGVVIVVGVGSPFNRDRPSPSWVPTSSWPASFAFNPKNPFLLTGGVSVLDGRDISRTRSPRLLVRAPSEAICQNADDESRARGTAAPTAIIAGLAADMLSREKVRAKLYLDSPEQEPEPERLLNRPVSAKIRDYLDQMSYDRRVSRHRVRSVWNGLDPRDPNIANYEA